MQSEFNQQQNQSVPISEKTNELNDKEIGVVEQSDLGGLPVEKITPEIASAIQSMEARRSGGIVEPGSIGAQAQSVAARNQTLGFVSDTTIVPEEIKLDKVVPEVASALQSLEARQSGGFVEPGGLASQALSASRKNSLDSQNMSGDDIGGIPVTKVTPELASALHSIEARRSGGVIEAGSLASQAQSVAARNIAQGLVDEKTNLTPEEIKLDKIVLEVASALQSIEARQTGGVVKPRGLASTALSAARRNSIDNTNSKESQQFSGDIGGIPMEKMTLEIASALQSIEARRSGGFIAPGSLAALAQSAARLNVDQGLLNENNMLKPEDLILDKVVPEIASALQSIEARRNGGFVTPGGLASQALSASRRNNLGGQSDNKNSVGQRRTSVGGNQTQIQGQQITDDSKVLGDIPLNKMTPEIANTLHSIEARRSGGIIASGGLASQAQSAAARNVAQGIAKEIEPEVVLGSIPMEKMTPEIASTLQSLEARRNRGFVEPGGLASQARAAAQRNVNQGLVEVKQNNVNRNSTGRNRSGRNSKTSSPQMGGSPRLSGSPNLSGSPKTGWRAKNSPPQTQRSLGSDKLQNKMDTNNDMVSQEQSPNNSTFSLTTSKLE